MRIIAGEAKGRRLEGPRGHATRPMQDRVKEAIFSSLGPEVVGARVADLYAGSGSMGLEALSRGADHVDFVERDRNALQALERNVAAVGLGGHVHRADVAAFLGRSSGPYTLAFVDPPYDLELALLEDVLRALARVLEEGAAVIVHRRKGDPAPAVGGPGLENLGLESEKTYGGAVVYRLRKGSR